MAGADYERELRDKLRRDGWVIVRSAGSHGFDLVALKPTEHMIIEVKSTKNDKFYTTSDKEQFDMLNAYAHQGFNVYYYVRWKGRKPKWKRWKLPRTPYPAFYFKPGEKDIKRL